MRARGAAPAVAACRERCPAAFRQEHGHATVPVDYPLNPKLGWWVTSTRQQRKKGKLTPAQIQQLDALGFVWDASRAKSPAVSPATFV